MLVALFLFTLLQAKQWIVFSWVNMYWCYSTYHGNVFQPLNIYISTSYSTSATYKYSSFHLDICKLSNVNFKPTVYAESSMTRACEFTNTQLPTIISHLCAKRTKHRPLYKAEMIFYTIGKFLLITAWRSSFSICMFHIRLIFLINGCKFPNL